MKILHYSLGMPPYRAGGLTKYCMDLMKVEQEEGHQVELLWPGVLNGGKTKIKKKKRKYHFENYEMINPLPVSLLGGIKDFAAYTRKVESKPFVDFLENNHYDVIHLHTIMGLPKEFLEVAKMLRIRVVYTSHDYFGICPTGSMLRDDKQCEFDRECTHCANCCRNAMSIKKARILQSVPYRALKGIPHIDVLKKIRNKK